jgi:tripartite-type tricarboxylate transporter receptor subunit TctC
MWPTTWRRRLLLCAFLCFAGTASADAYPARAIKLIVPVGQGVALDLVARMLADSMSRSLGQQMVVENVPGASGMLGAQTAARAAPDGHTLLLAPSSAMSSNVVYFKTLPYDPTRDFMPIAMVCDSAPLVVTVNPALGIKTFAELIARARAEPGALSYAVDATSGFSVVAGQLLTKRAGIEMVEIPYKVTGQALQDTAIGTTHVMIGSLAAVDGFVKAGKLRSLAITSAARFPAMPDLPTVAETLPGYRIDGWFTLLAPTGTPESVVQRLNREVASFLADPEVAQRMRQFALSSSGASTPEAIHDFMHNERHRWRSLAQELNIQPQ